MASSNYVSPLATSALRSDVGREMSSAEGWAQCALEGAFSDHQREIAGFFRRRVRDVETQADLVQEVFADYYEWLLRQSSPPTDSGGMLQLIATRRVADYWRHRPDWAELAAVADRPDERRRDGARASIVVDAIRELPPSERRIVAMRVLQGYEFREIAGVVKLSEAACRTRFVRGKRRLRGLISASLASSYIDT